ncbi:hypothetical protein BD560DRAFT_428763 [Blakeslea trispora]|nr:hypothetical protein BD560DRAFT_428763 [Blakeslea trispora]
MPSSFHISFISIKCISLQKSVLAAIAASNLVCETLQFWYFAETVVFACCTYILLCSFNRKRASQFPVKTILNDRHVESSCIKRRQSIYSTCSKFLSNFLNCFRSMVE